MSVLNRFMSRGVLNALDIVKVEESVSAVANTTTNINITAPQGYSYGVLIGIEGQKSWNNIHIETIGASGTNYPNRIKLTSSQDQTVTAKVLFFK